jgi:hypothetical protein
VPVIPRASPIEAVIFRTTTEFSTETRSVSEGPSVDSGEIATVEESGVPRSPDGFPKTSMPRSGISSEIRRA